MARFARLAVQFLAKERMPRSRLAGDGLPCAEAPHRLTAFEDDRTTPSIRAEGPASDPQPPAKLPADGITSESGGHARQDKEHGSHGCSLVFRGSGLKLVIRARG